MKNILDRYNEHQNNISKQLPALTNLFIQSVLDASSNLSDEILLSSFINRKKGIIVTNWERTSQNSISFEFENFKEDTTYNLDFNSSAFNELQKFLDTYFPGFFVSNKGKIKFPDNIVTMNFYFQINFEESDFQKNDNNTYILKADKQFKDLSNTYDLFSNDLDKAFPNAKISKSSLVTTLPNNSSIITKYLKNGSFDLVLPITKKID